MLFQVDVWRKRKRRSVAESWPRFAARQIKYTPGDRSFHFSDLHNKLPDLDLSLLMSFASELRALNLLHIQEGVISSPNYELYLLQVTQIGARFAERFIEGQM